MNGWRENRQLPYTPRQMFDLVADVERYPEFLPWIVALRVQERNAQNIIADMIVRFGILRETFTSHVSLTPYRHIQVQYLNGPLRSLNTDWFFNDDEAGGCHLHFAVSFEFKSQALERLARATLGGGARRIAEAFEKRAETLYAGNL